MFYSIDEELQGETLTTEPTGTVKAVGMGVMRGFADIDTAGTRVFMGLQNAVGNKRGAEKTLEFYEDVIKPARESWSPDPSSLSAAGEIFGGVSGIMPALMFGPYAPYILVGQAGINTAFDLVEQGVDRKTANIAGSIDAATMAALVRIPAFGKTIKETLGLVLVNPFAGAISRKGQQKLLTHYGYEDMAGQYDPFDPTALSIDATLGAFFGAYGHVARGRARKAAEKAFDTNKADTLDKLDALLSSKTYHEYLKSLPIEVEDAIGIIRQHQKTIKDMPFDPDRPGTVRTHLDSMNKAFEDIRQDKPVDVSKQVDEISRGREFTESLKADKFFKDYEELFDLDDEQINAIKTLLRANAKVNREDIDTYIGKRFAGVVKGGRADTTIKDILFQSDISHDEAKAHLEQYADPFIKKELTSEAWKQEFGETQSIKTPVGEVKLGENQYEKFVAKGRNENFGLIKPTLENPLFVMEVERPLQGAERQTAYIFIKAFKDENNRVDFVSISVKKEGNEVVISSHPKREKDVIKIIRDGKLLFKSTALDAAASTSPKQFTVAGGLPGNNIIPYGKAPDSLMGYSKDPAKQKGYDDFKYKYELPVKVTFPDGDVIIDKINGLNKSHALERARRNWSDAKVEKSTEAAFEDFRKRILNDNLLKQTHNNKAKAAVEFIEDGRAVIHAFEKADITSAVHELSHVFRRHLPERDLTVLNDIYKIKDGKWSVENEEMFAKQFERYLAEGHAPMPELKRVFERFKTWILEIYRNVIGEGIWNVHMNADVRKVFDGLFIESEIPLKKTLHPGEAAVKATIKAEIGQLDEMFKGMEAEGDIRFISQEEALNPSKDNIPTEDTKVLDFVSGKEITGKEKGTPVKTLGLANKEHIKWLRKFEEIKAKKIQAEKIADTDGESYDMNHHLEYIAGRIKHSEGPGKTFDAESGAVNGRLASGYPEWFQNKGYTKKNIIGIIEKQLAGKKLTDNQQNVIKDLVESTKDEYGVMYVIDEPAAGRVEAILAQKGDIPAIEGFDLKGKAVKGGMRAVIDNAKADLIKTTKLEDAYQMISNCVR